jgi:hypothetical protein
MDREPLPRNLELRRGCGCPSLQRPSRRRWSVKTDPALEISRLSAAAGRPVQLLAKRSNNTSPPDHRPLAAARKPERFPSRLSQLALHPTHRHLLPHRCAPAVSAPAAPGATTKSPSPFARSPRIASLAPGDFLDGRTARKGREAKRCGQEARCVHWNPSPFGGRKGASEAMPGDEAASGGGATDPGHLGGRRPRS